MFEPLLSALLKMHDRGGSTPFDGQPLVEYALSIGLKRGGEGLLQWDRTSLKYNVCSQLAFVIDTAYKLST